MQNCMLTEQLLEELEVATGIVPWTIEQHINEAVIIPAGCPHQVSLHSMAYLEAYFIVCLCSPLSLCEM